MRHFKQISHSIIFISAITIAVLVAGFRLATNPVHLTGHLKGDPKNDYIDGITVIVKGNNKVLAYTTADKQGNFEMTFTPNQERSFDFFVDGILVDAMLIASVKSFDSDTPEMTFYLPAQRKKNIFGLTACPKCNKVNKVYKIRYGDGLPVASIHVSPNGDTTYSPIVHGHYNAGSCMVGLPTYYCHRDKIRF